MFRGRWRRNIEVSSLYLRCNSNCSERITRNSTVEWGSFNGFDVSWEMYHWSEPEPESCHSIPKQHPHFLYVAERWETLNDPDAERKLDSLAAVLCSPTTWMSKVKVIDDGISPRLEMLPDEKTTPVNSNTWTLLEYSIPREQSNWLGNQYSYFLRLVPAAFDFRGNKKERNHQTGNSLYHPEVLEAAITNLTKVHIMG